jgi:hypothetical protein
MAYIQINWNNTHTNTTTTNTNDINTNGDTNGINTNGDTNDINTNGDTNTYTKYISFHMKGNVVGNVIFSETCAINVNNYMITTIECVTNTRTNDIINPNTSNNNTTTNNNNNDDSKIINKITEKVTMDELTFAVIDIKH